MVQRILDTEPGQLYVPAQITAEVDYLVRQRLGRSVAHTFIRDLADGRLTVLCPSVEDYELIERYDATYSDLNVGLSDLTIVALAVRLNIARILTFDERHFRILRTPLGGSFTLVPADESG